MIHNLLIMHLRLSTGKKSHFHIPGLGMPPLYDMGSSPWRKYEANPNTTHHGLKIQSGDSEGHNVRYQRHATKFDA